jgi:2-C-methyl-D-erythritol 4-phosphate cytidylyltransferase/2-C-methyl-D-erythritol 2,4-cyclodiphosphate synthase
MVHDAARPFATEALLHRLKEALSKETGAIPVVPITEAVKRLNGDSVSAMDRDGLYATQTPQAFFRETLTEVLTEREGVFKDEAEAWLSAGLPLRCVEGEKLNFKVTWPEDLEMAEALAEKRQRKARSEANSEVTRVGIGYDVHRMTPERELVLGGVAVPSPLGLLGHSDADVLAHAVADALLGAAGLPDIGNLFPASDERYRGADSLELLRRVVDMVKKDGWEVVWVDSVLEAQVPRLNSFLPAMREKIAAVLGCTEGEELVNIKAKSAEKTGDPGMGRSIVCRAVATLRRQSQAATGGNNFARSD